MLSKPNRPLRTRPSQGNSSTASSSSASAASSELPPIADFDYLDRAIRCLDWEGDLDLRRHLWNSYLRLMEEGHQLPAEEIGTAEFWDIVYDDYFGSGDCIGTVPFE